MVYLELLNLMNRDIFIKFCGYMRKMKVWILSKMKQE